MKASLNFFGLATALVMAAAAAAMSAALAEPISGSRAWRGAQPPASR
jgi:hypothetical protein